MKTKFKIPRWALFTVIILAFIGGLFAISMLPAFASRESSPPLAVAEAAQNEEKDANSDAQTPEANETSDEHGSTETPVEDEPQADDAVVVEATPSEEPVQETPTTCSYCGSAEHTKDYCAVRAVDNGAVGRLRIPSVGVDVAVYDVTWYSLRHTTESDNYTQAVTDAWDSAAQIVYLGQTVIGDHNNQGFSAINNCSEGTYAYIDMGDSVLTYVCTGIQHGRNPGGYLTGADGDSVYTSYFNPDGLTLYTCLDHNFNVAIVTFQPA